MAQTARPNVLFIALDDFNDFAGVLGGHPQAYTPNIDDLAAQGTLFTSAHVAAPLCNPSRVSFMTGISPGRSGVINQNEENPWRDYLPNAVSLNQAFHDAGYDTVGYGKIYHGGRKDHDVDNWDLYQFWPANPKPPADEIPVNGLTEITQGGPGGGDWGLLDEPDSEWSDYKVATWVEEFFDTRDPADPDPFFLAVGLTSTHSPWYVPQAYYDLIAGGVTDNIVLPSVDGFDLADVGDVARRWAKPDIWSPLTSNPDKVREGLHSYLAIAAFMDAQIGRILGALDSSAFGANTIVVLLSDHGYHLTEKETWGKNNLWEEDTRVPFIIRAPADVLTTPPAEVPEAVNVSAIYPTLLDLAGISLPDYPPQDPLYQIDYRSLVPLMNGAPSPQWGGPAVTFREDAVTLRMDDYRFALYRDDFVELYDRLADSNEWFNIADLPEHQLDITDWTCAARRYLAGEHGPFGFVETGDPCAFVWDDSDGDGGTASLGDRVWMDTDGDGIHDAGEPGLGGVTVQLKNCNGDVLDVRTTGSSGAYGFNNLAAGCYKFGVIAPAGYRFSPLRQGGDHTKDSNVDPSTGSYPWNIVLEDGADWIGFDAGLVPTGGGTGGTASLGDRIWVDTDGDGIQDAGEPGLGGVTVQLKNCNGDVLDVQTTDGNGAYVFSNLAAGCYKLEVIAPPGYRFSPLMQGGDHTKDSNVDQSTGSYPWNIPLEDGYNWTGFDAGLVPTGGGTASLGDLVWVDANGNGIQDPGEIGLGGVTVALTACDGTVLDTTTTDADGGYLFDNLAAGCYKIAVTAPSGFGFSPRSQGDDRTRNSDVDQNTGVYPWLLNMTEVNTWMGIDAGLVPDGSGTGGDTGAGTASLGDLVWVDANGNGIQDPGELGLGGVTVALTACDGTALDTTTTDADGGYLFDNLAAGCYKIAVTAPSGFGFSPRNQGSDRTRNSDVDPVTGVYPWLLNMTEVNNWMGIDAGLVRL